MVTYAYFILADCDDPAPDHGQSDLPLGTVLGAVAGVSCDPGYVLVGDAIITCELGPTWSDAPVCLRGKIQVTSIPNICE